MATPKLYPQDRKDLDKFAKYLVYKCAQIIIQSRSGEKIHTPSKLVSSGTDWFNLSIRDDPEIQTEIKNIYGSSSLMDGEKVCFEISVKTSEGKETALETWFLEATDYCDPTSRVSCSVYARMGMLLKSLLIATRAVPAYSVSREQAQDRYIMCYRMHLGMPRITSLGDSFVKHNVGLVPSPAGTIALSVAYRLKKDFSVKHHLADVLAKDFHDNHYRSESVAPGTAEICCARSETSAEKESAGGDKELRRRSAADVISDNRSHIVIGSHKTNCTNQVKQSKTTTVEKKIRGKVPHDLDATVASIPCNVRSFSNDCNDRKIEDNSEKRGENFSHPETESTNASPSKQSPGQREVPPRGYASERISPGAAPAPDKSNVIGVKSEEKYDENELRWLYHDLKVAPPLTMFQQATTNVKEMLHCITSQLAQFETNAKDFDDFVNSITEVID